VDAVAPVSSPATWKRRCRSDLTEEAAEVTEWFPSVVSVPSVVELFEKRNEFSSAEDLK